MEKASLTSCKDCTEKGLSVFCELQEKSLKNLSTSKTINNYKKGDVIFLQNNPPFGLYCINSGKVKISKCGKDGKESIIRIAGPGDILGHRSLFSKKEYTATATVLEESVICFLDKNLIYKTIKDDPTLALNLIEKLSKEMGAAETRTAAMFQSNVCERLADLLLTLMNSYGIKEKQGHRLDIKLTREEMASMVGTSHETLIRFISDFKKEGIIKQEGKVIFIIDEDRLREIALGT